MTHEDYQGSRLVTPVGDSERLQHHVVLRSLACQLYRVSIANSELSRRERSDEALSVDEYSLMQTNRERMTQIEDLITTTSRSIVFERV